MLARSDCTQLFIFYCVVICNKITLSLESRNEAQFQSSRDLPLAIEIDYRRLPVQIAKYFQHPKYSSYYPLLSKAYSIDLWDLKLARCLATIDAKNSIEWFLESILYLSHIENLIASFRVKGARNCYCNKTIIRWCGLNFTIVYITNAYFPNTWTDLL